MATISVVANLGNRDLAVRDFRDDRGVWYRPTPHGAESTELQRMLGCTPGARAVGESLQRKAARLLGTPSEGAEQQLAPEEFKAPILAPVIEHILKNVQDNDTLQLVLVATDQPATMRPEHREKDTITIAPLIARLLEMRIRERLPASPDARIARYTGSAVDRDALWHFYQGVLADLTDRDSMYVVTMGSTPAMNDELRNVSLGMFGARVRVVAVQEPVMREGEEYDGSEGPAHEVSTMRARAVVLRRNLQLLLQHQHYAAALVETESALSQDEVADGDARQLYLLLQHLAARSRGDYAGARQTWEALQGTVAEPIGCEVPRPLQVVRDQVAELAAAAEQPRHPLRIQDLLAALNMSIARRDTIALLARLGTLVDLLRDTMYEHVGATYTPRTVQFEDASPEVRDRLRRTPNLLMPGTLTMKRSIGNELRAFDVVVQCVDRTEPFRLATKFMKEVQPLTALRNRALHENRIVTYEQVVCTAATQRGGLDGLVRRLRHVLHALPGKPITKLPTVEQLTDAARDRCNALVAM